MTSEEEQVLHDLEAELAVANEKLVDALQHRAELEDTVADLRRQLTEMKRQLDSAKLEAAVQADQLKLETERHGMTRRLVKSLEHTAEQWRQTAAANERLHNVALDENQQLRAKLKAAQS